MFPALKLRFLSQEKCPTVLRKMFNDPVSLVWIYFLESQMKVCSISIKKIQSDSISGSEVAIELDILPNKMKSKRDEDFHTTKLVSLLSDVEDVYSHVQFMEVANSFYNTFLLNLKNGVTMFSHWICFIGHYLRILLGRKSCIVQST
jgi:hypothetical protein